MLTIWWSPVQHWHSFQTVTLRQQIWDPHVRRNTTYNATINSGSRAVGVVTILGIGRLGLHMGVKLSNKIGFRIMAIARGKVKEDGWGKTAKEPGTTAHYTICRKPQNATDDLVRHGRVVVMVPR